MPKRLKEALHAGARAKLQCMFRLMVAELCITTASCSPVKRVTRHRPCRQKVDRLRQFPVYYVPGLRTVDREDPDDELIRRRFNEIVPLQVHAPHPESLQPQSLYQMATDESTGTSYQNFS